MLFKWNILFQSDILGREVYCTFFFCQSNKAAAEKFLIKKEISLPDSVGLPTHPHALTHTHTYTHTHTHNQKHKEEAGLN